MTFFFLLLQKQPGIVTSLEYGIWSNLNRCLGPWGCVWGSVFDPRINYRFSPLWDKSCVSCCQEDKGAIAGGKGQKTGKQSWSICDHSNEPQTASGHSESRGEAETPQKQPTACHQEHTEPRQASYKCTEYKTTWVVTTIWTWLWKKVPLCRQE